MASAKGGKGPKEAVEGEAIGRLEPCRARSAMVANGLVIQGESD
jgi:hypothetical protein